MHSRAVPDAVVGASPRAYGRPMRSEVHAEEPHMTRFNHTKSIVAAVAAAGALLIAAPAGASVLEPVTNGWNPDQSYVGSVTAIAPPSSGRERPAERLPGHRHGARSPDRSGTGRLRAPVERGARRRRGPRRQSGGHGPPSSPARVTASTSATPRSAPARPCCSCVSHCSARPSGHARASRRLGGPSPQRRRGDAPARRSGLSRRTGRNPTGPEPRLRAGRRLASWSSVAPETLCAERHARPA